MERAPIGEEDDQAFTGLAKASVLMRFRNHSVSMIGIKLSSPRGR